MIRINDLECAPSENGFRRPWKGVLSFPVIFLSSEAFLSEIIYCPIWKVIKVWFSYLWSMPTISITLPVPSISLFHIWNYQVVWFTIIFPITYAYIFLRCLLRSLLFPIKIASLDLITYPQNTIHKNYLAVVILALVFQILVPYSPASVL